MSSIEKVTRRDFLRQTGLGTGALVLGCHVSGGGIGGSLLAQGNRTAFEPNHFIAIKSDGSVVIIAHRSEMGQGIRSTLPAVVADELEADWSRVEVRQAIGDEKYGNQWTDGSRSVTKFLMPMREAGATARHMLVEAGAEHLGVDVAECEASQHKVRHKASGRTVDYGDLARRAAAMPVPRASQIRLKSPEDFRYIGKETMPFADLDDMVTGKAIYGADIDLPGMKTAMIVRCPVTGGKYKSHDDSAALKVPGVEKVWFVEGKGGLGGGFQPVGGVAILAEHTWAAWEGRRVLEVEWDLGANASYESEAYRKTLESSTAKPGKVVRSKGDVDAAFEGAHKVVEASYYMPHLAQAPMEPLVAVGLMENGRLDVWAPTQSPQKAQTEIEAALGIEHTTTHHDSAYVRPKGSSEIEVTVHVTLLGGGFGRKSKPDYVVEAALLARDNPGVPVRVQWTREDDMEHGYYHAVSHQVLKAAVDAQGRPTAWLQRSAFPSFNATFNGQQDKMGSDIELAQGLLGMPYDVPNIRLENCEAEAHTRIGWMRSVANIYHSFAINSFADELAAAAGRDPKDYMLELIGPGRIVDLSAEGVENFHNNEGDVREYPVDTSRLRNVVEQAAQEAGWGKQMPVGRGLGIAAHRSFLSYVAMVVDASISDSNELVVHEVHGVIDCGLAVNPERVRSQMEGGIIYGLSLAIHDDITFRDGVVEQHNFDEYPTLRINQTPKISVHIIDSDAPPGGVGEPPTPPVAPALTNAIAAASGQRVRDLPLWRTFDFG